MALLSLALFSITGNVEHHWVFKTSSQTGYTHMATIDAPQNSSALPGPLAVCFQRTDNDVEGDDSQSIYLKISNDGGSTWMPHRVLVKKGFESQAVWGP